MNKIYDFNHLFSNICYIIYGIGYIIFVWCKSKWVHKRSDPPGPDPGIVGRSETDSSRSKTGIMPQFGIYYAMGFTLFIQGVLSLCYHVCPTSMSLQFDTTPMYIICILGLVKFYQVHFFIIFECGHLPEVVFR